MGVQGGVYGWGVGEGAGGCSVSLLRELRHELGYLAREHRVHHLDEFEIELQKKNKR